MASLVQGSQLTYVRGIWLGLEEGVGELEGECGWMKGEEGLGSELAVLCDSFLAKRTPEMGRCAAMVAVSTFIATEIVANVGG